MNNLIFLILCIFLYGGIQAKPDEIPGRTALDNFPLIDGHNDLPLNLLKLYHNKLEKYNFHEDWKSNPLAANCGHCHTDFPKLKQGKLGAQFWSAYINCQHSKNQVAETIDQIDVIKRLVHKYRDDLHFSTRSDDILTAFQQKKIASFIGVEGGNSIDNRLSVLRAYYDLGVRYLTLTHSCNLDWADSSIIDNDAYSPKKNLTDFGKAVVLEMNRLGMLVDLSHVSKNVMIEAIGVSRAPIIFSHSSSRFVYNHTRNVDDDVLKLLKENGGIIMVNFFPSFVGDNGSISDVADHINHIVDVTGADHIGIGADFDGIPTTPTGLKDVSEYPNLFDLLRKQNPERWTIENLEKLAGRNFVKVFKKVEDVKLELINEDPREDVINN